MPSLSQGQRNQRIIDSMFNTACRAITHCGRQYMREEIDLRRPGGRKGDGESKSYDFGNAYSRPAVVADGKVVLVG